MAKKLSFNATITDRRDVTQSLAVFRVAPDEPLAPVDGKRAFLPGQYVTLGLPASSAPGPEWVQRPFSVASAPEDPRGLEIYVRRVEQPVSPAPFSHLLFDAKPPARMYVRPAATGRFTLSHTVGENNPRLKLFVAAGTGIAPFMSMLRSRAMTTSEDLTGYVLLHGVRSPEELAYHDELLRLAELRGLRYLPLISRPALAPSWDGEVGRVTDLLRPERIEQTESRFNFRIAPEHTYVFVCGLSDMIANAIDCLLVRGYVPAHRKIRALHAIPDGVPTTIFFEQYDDLPLVKRETSSHTVA